MKLVQKAIGSIVVDEQLVVFTHRDCHAEYDGSAFETSSINSTDCDDRRNIRCSDPSYGEVVADDGR